MKFIRVESETARRALTSLCLVIMSFVFSLQASNNIWKIGSTYTDSSVFHYIGRVIAAGGMPYRDTFDHKGPLMYLINFWGIQIDSWRGVWVLEFIAILVTFFVMYKIARFVCDRPCSLLVTFVSSSALFKYFEGGNLTEEYAMPFIAIGIYTFVFYFRKGTIKNWQLLLSGFSLGVVCMLRANMISIWLVMCVGVLFEKVRNKHSRELVRFAFYFILGFLLLVLPICFWLWQGHAFNAFVEDYLQFNAMYSMHDGVTGQAMSAGKALKARSHSFLHFYNDALVLLAIGSAVYFTLKKRKYFNLLYVIYMFVSLGLLSMSGREYMHYGMVIVPALAYPIALVVGQAEGMNSENRRILAVIAVCVFSFVVFPGWMHALSRVPHQYRNRSKIQINEMEMDISRIVREHSTPADKILVCGNWDIIYNLSDRFAATKYSYQSPPLKINSSLRNDYFDEISRSLPKVIVIGPEYGSYNADMKRRMQILLSENHYQKVFAPDSDKDEKSMAYIYEREEVKE